MALYTKNGETFSKIDILTCVKQFALDQHITEFEYYIIAKSQKIKIRFFAIKVPDHVANQRRRKLRKTAQKHGHKPKKRTLELCEWSFFMTNIPLEKNISVKELLALYPLRWSVELYFKQFKSVLNMHKTEAKSNPHRIKCEILGKAIVAMFIFFCYSTTRALAWETYHEEISIEKTFKCFKRQVGLFVDYLLNSLNKATVFLQEVVNKIYFSCRKYRQKSRHNSLDVINDCLIFKELKYKKIKSTDIVEDMP